MGPLTVLGATGYTGRLCAAVAAHGHLRLCLAGRNRARLSALADDLGRTAGTRPDVRVVDATRPDEVTALASDSAVVVSTVGPYARLRLPVVDADLVDVLAAAGPRAELLGGDA